MILTCKSAWLPHARGVVRCRVSSVGDKMSVPGCHATVRPRGNGDFLEECLLELSDKLAGEKCFWRVSALLSRLWGVFDKRSDDCLPLVWFAVCPESCDLSRWPPFLHVSECWEFSRSCMTWNASTSSWSSSSRPLCSGLEDDGLRHHSTPKDDEGTAWGWCRAKIDSWLEEPTGEDWERLRGREGPTERGRRNTYH